VYDVLYYLRSKCCAVWCLIAGQDQPVESYMLWCSLWRVIAIAIRSTSRELIIAIQLLSLVCSTNLVGCSCSNVANTRLMVFYKTLNNLSVISLDHLSVSSWHTRASIEKKFMSLPVCTDVFKHSFFPRTITNWNSLPLAVRLLQSTQSFHGPCWTRHPPTIADNHDTSAVTGGLHPLLDISRKN